MKASERRKNNRIKQRKRDKLKRTTVDRVKEPHCIVTTRGSVSLDVRRLSLDVRKIMEPNTSVRLNNTRDNSIKDFVAVSAQLDVTHLILFTQTSLGMYMKLCRLPRGPTITFRINSYTRTKDIASTAKKVYNHGDRFATSPCIMTNLQPNEGDLQLQATARMLLDMFPTITPNNASPHKIKRCCLFHYDEEKNSFDLRHYAIRVVPVEICKGLKKLMGNKVPNLGRFMDVSELITKSGVLSDSEAEDDPNAQVTVPHKKAKKAVGVPLKSSVRLHELGPRLSLELYKVEEGLLEGQVLYHGFIAKTDEEKLELQEIRRAKRDLKMKRKKLQEKNVEEKEKSQEDHKKKCLDGMGIDENNLKGKGKKGKAKDEYDNGVEADNEDDDEEYYRKEVGEEPDPEIFGQKRKKVIETGPRQKKMKKDIGRGTKSSPFERKKFKANKNSRSEGSFKKQPGKGNSRKENGFAKRPSKGAKKIRKHK